MKTLAAAVSISLTLMAGQYSWSRPEGEFRSSLGRLEYDPSRSCIKPSRPFGNDQFSRQNYLNEAQRYIECLEEAAVKDTTYAQKVVSDGYETAVNDFIAEVKRGY